MTIRQLLMEAEERFEEQGFRTRAMMRGLFLCLRFPSTVHIFFFTKDRS